MLGGVREKQGRPPQTAHGSLSEEAQTDLQQVPGELSAALLRPAVSNFLLNEETCHNLSPGICNRSSDLFLLRGDYECI